MLKHFYLGNRFTEQFLKMSASEIVFLTTDRVGIGHHGIVTGIEQTLPGPVAVFKGHSSCIVR